MLVEKMAWGVETVLDILTISWLMWASPMKKLQRFDVAFCDIAENLESALEQFRGIYEDLENEK